jgi:hypothetical protein
LENEYVHNIDGSGHQLCTQPVSIDKANEADKELSDDDILPPENP